MTPTISLAVGQSIVTRNGNPGIVEALEGDRVILRVPSGQLKRVPLDAINPQPGQRVRLKGTDRIYTLIEIFDYVYCIGGDRHPQKPHHHRSPSTHRR